MPFHYPYANFTFLLEFLILIVFPYPSMRQLVTIQYTDYINFQSEMVQQDFGDYLLVFMFLRVYFVFKCMSNYSVYNDAFSKRLCKDYGFYPGFSFIMKTHSTKNPRLMLALLFTLTVLLLSY